MLPKMMSVLPLPGASLGLAVMSLSGQVISMS